MTPEEERRVLEAADFVLWENRIGATLGCAGFVILAFIIGLLWWNA